MPVTQSPHQEEHAPLPTSPDALMQTFDQIGVSYDLYHHEAVFTVAESDKVDAKIPGTHCRNMFLRDKKKRMFLVSLANETLVDLKKLEKVLGCARLSFGSPERLWENLGVRPGSVCPYAIINDAEKNVTLILDAWMMAQERVNFHPLINTMTVNTPPQGIQTFATHLNHPFQIMDLSGAKPD